jgi:hypothetical protein
MEDDKIRLIFNQRYKATLLHKNKIKSFEKGESPKEMAVGLN